MLTGYNKEPLFHVAKKYKLNTKQSFPTKLDPVNIRGEYTMAKTRTKYRRRRNRRRRGIVKRRIPRALTTKTKIIRCKASNYVPISMATGAMSMVPIQGNSCDDPFTSGGNGQPLGFDQWKALYRSAYIIGSKVTVTYHNTGSNSVMCGINKMDVPQGTTSLASYEYYKELPGTKSRLVSPDVDHTRFSMSASTKRHLSAKNIKDEEDLKMNLITETQPTRIFYYHVWFQPTDQAATINGTEAVIDVDYIVLLTDPIIPSRSTET